MSCTSCSTNTLTNDGIPKGCKSNGSCGTDGCSHLEVHNWLSGMELPTGYKVLDVVEVRFKNGRKGFYRNIYDHSLSLGDAVAVETSPGHDIGMVSLTGELVRIQMKKKNVNYSAGDMKKVYRKASQEDLDKWKVAREKEDDTMFRSRKIITELGLDMKMSDVEYQGDGTKATFYYTADERVDFRALIKKLAEEFKIRVEMRQIGARQEAGRLGGIGSCGRELCCTTWLSDFRSVSTSAARYQQLSLNPQKLAGQCGKLKCCLNYELDMYLEAYRDFPSNEVKLETKQGRAFHFKTDIFKKLLWYIPEGADGGAPVALTLDRVNEIIAMNKKGKKPESLKDFSLALDKPVEPKFDNVVGQDDLTRFDKKKKQGKGRGRNQRNKQGAKRSGISAKNTADKKPVKKGGQNKGKNPNQTKTQASSGDQNKPKKTGNKRPNRGKRNPNKPKTNPNG